MATRIKSSQIADGAIVAADLHSAIAINTTQSGTFGSVNAGSLTVDDIVIDGATLYLNTTTVSNHLTIDAPQDIILDSNAVKFFDAATGASGTLTPGTEHLSIYSQVDSPVIQSQKTDGTMRFTGKWTNGSGTVQTSAGLTLDFSNQGRATLNENLTVGANLQVNSDLQVNGNTTLGNASTDTVTTPGVLSVTNTTTSTNDSTGALTVAGGIGVAENAYIGGNVVVTGNLTVEGTSVTLNTTALDVEDKNITLNYHATADTSASADGAGITIQDAVDASNDATILWDATNDKFDFSHTVNVTGNLVSDGLQVDGIAIIDGGTGVSSTGVLHVRQNGDGHGNGIAITSSNATSHRIWKDVDGNLNIGPSSDTSAFVQDLGGQVGLGTTDPSLKLDVATSSGAAGSFNRHLALTRGTTTGGFLGTYRAAANNDVDRIALGVGTTPTVTISSNLLDVTGGISVSEVRHNVRPSLLLDFANSKQLDPRMSFTRSSTGLYWDGKTTVKAEENLWFPSTSYGQEAALDDSTVTVTNNNATAPDGTSTAAKVQDNSASVSHYIVKADSSIETGVTHTLSFYVKYGSGYGWVGIGLASAKLAWFDVQNGTQGSEHSSVQSTSITSVGNGWYRCAVAINPPNTTDYWQIRLASADNGVTYTANGSFVYVWGAQLEKRSSVTSYIATTTVPVVKFQPALQSAHVNSPRFDHDPVTGESKGLLIEEARTNYAPYSTPDSNWIQAAYMITPNYAIAPDGTQTAGFIHESATSRQQLAYTHSGTTLTSGSTYTFSAYAKAYTHDTFQMHSYGDSSKTFYLSNPSNSSDSTMTHVGNGWYRCTWTKTKSNTTSTIYLGFDGASYAGDANKGVLFWGAQVELGTFATSLIKTVGSTNTRALEELADYNLESSSSSGRQSWFSSYKGTMFTDYTLFGSYVDAPYPRIHVTSIVGLRTSIEMMHYGGNVQHNFFLNNSLKLNQNRAVAINNKISGAMSWDFNQNLASSAINGSATNNTINGVPQRLARIYIGTSGWNGHIRKFAFYRDHFSNAELVALTEE